MDYLSLSSNNNDFTLNEDDFSSDKIDQYSKDVWEAFQFTLYHDVDSFHVHCRFATCAIKINHWFAESLIYPKILAWPERWRVTSALTNSSKRRPTATSARIGPTTIHSVAKQRHLNALVFIPTFLFLTTSGYDYCLAFWFLPNCFNLRLLSFPPLCYDYPWRRKLMWCKINYFEIQSQALAGVKCSSSWTFHPRKGERGKVSHTSIIFRGKWKSLRCRWNGWKINFVEDKTT